VKRVRCKLKFLIESSQKKKEFYSVWLFLQLEDKLALTIPTNTNLSVSKNFTPNQLGEDGNDGLALACVQIRRSGKHHIVGE
jgi:hypothetical protein